MASRISRADTPNRRATNDSIGNSLARAKFIVPPMVMTLLLSACGGGGGGSGNPVTTGTSPESRPDKVPVKPPEKESNDSRPSPSDSQNDNAKPPDPLGDPSGDPSGNPPPDPSGNPPPDPSGNPPPDPSGNPSGDPPPDPSLFSPHFDPNIPFDPGLRRPFVAPKDQFNSDEGLQPGVVPPKPQTPSRAPPNDRSDDRSNGDGQAGSEEFPWRSPFTEERNLSWANIPSDDPFADPIPRFPTSRQTGNRITIRIEEGMTDLFALIVEEGRSMPEIFAPELDVPGEFFQGPDDDSFHLVHEPANQPKGSPERLVIKFTAKPDFERPGDTDGNNTYEFSLGAYLASFWDDLIFEVTVLDAPEPIVGVPDPIVNLPEF